MKTTISLLLFALVASTAFSQAKVSLKIIQNGAAVNPVNGEYELKKAPFAVEFTFDVNAYDGVFVNADFTDAVYKTADKAALPDLQDIPYKIVKEENFNTNKQIAVAADNWSFWYYNKSTNEYRFDRDIKTVDANTVTATRTIEQVYFPVKEKTLKVAELTEPLYLFFLVTNPYNQRGVVRELYRQKMKLNFK
ncbi:hypothetical protein [Longitalea luteola]|uniref:hypothetical protein n=1 Tax=Longitalea luteola TaxID=2812563 RepID=UPI001A9611D0|nr:hypothetical protein [Longitalea luteola]